MRTLRFLALILIVFAVVPAAADTGIITGMVTSANNAAIPDATVTLSDVENGSAIDYVPNNPQLTSNFSGSLPGTYTFTGVPYGTYYLIAEKDGASSYPTSVIVQSGTATANIVIPVNITLETGTVTPQPTQQYTYVPVKIAPPPPQSTVNRSPGLGLLAVILVLVIVGIVTLRSRKP